MKSIFNTIFISAEDFRQQEKSPFFAGLLCLFTGILGYHRLYMKHDLRFVLILIITGGMGYLGITQSWYFLLGWAIWFVLQALVYFTMGFIGVHLPRLEETNEVEFGRTAPLTETDSPDLPLRAGRPRQFKKPTANRKLDLTDDLAIREAPQADNWTTIENQAAFSDTTDSNTQPLTKMAGPTLPRQAVSQKTSNQPQPILKKQKQPSPVFEAFEERMEEKLDRLSPQQEVDSRHSLDLTEDLIKELDLYPTHLAALEAVRVPQGEIWNEPATKRALLLHFKTFINLIGEGLAADPQLLTHSDYAYLVSFFQHKKVNGPMKLLLQSLVNLAENILFNQFVDESHLTSDYDLQIISSLLPDSLLNQIKAYYNQQRPSH